MNILIVAGCAVVFIVVVLATLVLQYLDEHSTEE